MNGKGLLWQQVEGEPFLVLKPVMRLLAASTWPSIASPPSPLASPPSSRSRWPRGNLDPVVPWTQLTHSLDVADSAPQCRRPMRTAWPAGRAPAPSRTLTRGAAGLPGLPGRLPTHLRARAPWVFFSWCTPIDSVAGTGCCCARHIWHGMGGWDDGRGRLGHLPI